MKIEIRCNGSRFVMSKHLVNVIMEETLFRFLLFGLLRVWIGSIWAIVISAGIFALCHFLHFRLKMVLVALGLGLVLGIVYACWSGAVGERIGYMVCVIIHYSLCRIGQEKGWLDRWKR